MRAAVVPAVPVLRERLAAVRAEGQRVGFVPTMGALHDGHLELIRRARASSDHVVVSVFVNPLQFAAHEDLDAYPRDLEHDVLVASEAGADAVFAPSVIEMYPQPMATVVSVPALGSVLEGEVRPHHFAGVATVVAKLFGIVGPCAAFFGEKDWQQLCVVRRIVADLSIPVEVVGVPTVRDADGLALSSRNAYLDAGARAAAPVLHRALVAGVLAIETGSSTATEVEAAMHAVLAEQLAPEAVDYAVCVDAATLAPAIPLAGEVRLLVAARFGTTRLIDNVGAHVA